MAAAVIELDSLPDTVRSAAQNHDFLLLCRLGFVLFFVGRVHVWSERFELGGTCVDTLENRSNIVTRALQTNYSRRGLPDLRQLFVAGTDAFRLPQQIFGGRLYRHRSGPPVHRRQLSNLVNEPRIDLRQFTDFASGQPALDRGQYPVNPIWSRGR